MELLEKILAYFISKNFCEEIGVDCFMDFTPDEPENIIIVSEYAGGPAVHYDTMVSRSLQIQVRSKSIATAKAKSHALHKSLWSDTYKIELSPDYWCLIYLRQTPFKIKVDEKGCSYYGFNIGVTTQI